MDHLFLFADPASTPEWTVPASVLVILAIDLALINYCLNDLNRRATVIGDRRFWAAAIVLGGPLGQIAYWLYGRGEY
jgi:hypothetical protein